MFEIGTTLRDARVRRDISLQRAEDDTKIRVKYIQAMENEDFDVLPGGTYVKGFLRTYAEYLGIDYQPLLDEYNERYGTGEHRDHIIHGVGPITVSSSSGGHGDPAPARLRRGGSQKNRNYVFVALLAVAIIAVLAYLGWGNSPSSQPTLVTTTEMDAGAATATAAAPTATASRTTPTATQPEGLETLEITSTKSDNWVEIREESSSGDVIWAGILAPGDSQTFDKTKMKVAKLWLKVGSAVGLKISVNGKEQEVPQKTGASYLITAAGMGQG